MSKYPTNLFSARDLACIEYGEALMLLRRDFYERNLFPSGRRTTRQTVDYARHWRNAIFATPDPQGNHDVISLCRTLRSLRINFTEYAVLEFLRDGQYHQMKSIIEALNLTPGAASQLISALILPKSLVKKTRSPQDERTVWVKLTAHGKRILHQIHHPPQKN